MALSGCPLGQHDAPLVQLDLTHALDRDDHDARAMAVGLDAHDERLRRSFRSDRDLLDDADRACLSFDGEADAVLENVSTPVRDKSHSRPWGVPQVDRRVNPNARIRPIQKAARCWQFEDGCAVFRGGRRRLRCRDPRFLLDPEGRESVTGVA